MKKVIIAVFGSIVFFLVVFLIKNHPLDLKNLSEKTRPVPPPSAQDTIRSFGRLINEDKIDGAVGLLDVADNSDYRLWEEQLSNFSEFNIIEIKPVCPQKNNCLKYEMRVEVVLKNQITDSPIPNYGWNNGINMRWISLNKKGDLYRITEIATGP